MNAPVLHQRWLVITLLVFAAVYVSFLYDAHRLPPAARRLRAADIPISVEELKEKYALEPVEDNGAFLYIEAINKLIQQDEQTLEHLPYVGDLQFEYGHEFTPQQRDALRKYVAMNAESIALIQEAQKKSFVHRPLDRYDPATSSYFLKIRSLARLICCTMLDASLSGDVERLEQMVVTGLHLHEILASGGVLIDELIAQSICFMVLDSLENSLVYLRPSTSGIHKWQQTLAQERYTDIEATKQALRYEMTLYYTTGNFEGPLFASSEVQSAETMPFNFTVEWTQFLYLPQSAYIREVNTLTTVDDELLNVLRKTGSIDAHANRYGFRYFMFYWYYGRTYRFVGNLLAQAAATQAALASLLYLEDHDRLPNTLEDLVPDYLDTVPRDPFTPDGTIRYQIREDLAVFYSIGLNEQDDGGTKNLNDDGDLIFRLPLPQPVGNPKSGHEVVSEMRTLTKGGGDLKPPHVFLETGGYL